MSPNPSSPLPAATRLTWRQRAGAFLQAQLSQGATPDRLALSIGVGAACSLVPFLGFTTLLNFAVGAWLRLNQPVMQILNQLLGPVQLLLIIPYIRAGEKIWGARPVSISVRELAGSFKDDPAGFLQRFGWTGLHAATAWALSLPLVIGGLYFLVRPVLFRVSARARAGASATAP
jgi:uncharacterized protein (DUF2062 family)